MIKKLIILAVFLAIPLTGFSQEKKFILMGGDLNSMFSSNNISGLSITNLNPYGAGFTPVDLIGTIGANKGDYTSLHLGLNPNISYYLTDKLLIGGGLEITNEINKYNSEFITKSSSISFLFSPLFRYYFINGFYGQVQYNIGKIKEEIFCNYRSVPTSTGFRTLNYSSVFNGSSNGMSLIAGYSVPLANCIIADIGINYNLTKNRFEYVNEAEKGKYVVSQNMALITLGFKYILVRKT